MRPRPAAPRPLRSAFVPAALLALAAGAAAQEMDVVDPVNTGIPGELIRLVAHAPSGDVWVAARWPFWGEGGIGVYDRHDRVWSVWTNVSSPIPSEFVNDIEFDSQGVAWIATGAGLVRWDGTTWTVWDTSNSPMQLGVVADISIAPDDHVWVNDSSFSGGGDAIWDFDGQSSWVRHAVPEELPWPAPWTDLAQVFADGQGRVWVANETLTGVAELVGDEWVLRGASVGKFDEMAEDQFGNLWLNSNLVGGGPGFYRYDGQQFTTYPFGSSTTLTSDPEDGTIYAGNWGGTVVRTSDGGATLETFATGLNQVYSIAPDPAGPDVWIGVLPAVGHWSDSGALLEDFNTYNTGMPWFWVDYMSNDRDGFFWMATGEAGLSRFDGRRWRNWGAHNAGAEPYPFAGNEPMGGAYQDVQGVHWFGGNGIARWHSATGTFDGFWNWQNNPGMGVTQFPFFAEDAAGELFAASEYGAVFRFDPDAQLWIQEPVAPYAVLGLPGMLADGEGHVWVAAWFDLHEWDGGSWSQVTLPDPNYFFDLGGINAFALAPDDTFWFATGGGVVHWDRTTFTLYDATNTPMPGPFVTGIDVRGDGLIGLCSRGTGASQPSGACLVDGDPTDPASWTTYLYGASPLPHWQIERCAFDPQGDLWVSALSEGAAVIRCGVWQDVGASLAGTYGPPFLQGKGILTGGLPFWIQLEGALEGAPGGHVIGFSSLNLPALGGLLVPSPDIVVPLVTDGAGAAALAGTWPAGLPAGLQLWFQSWVFDPAGVQLAAASNAVVGTLP